MERRRIAWLLIPSLLLLGLFFLWPLAGMFLSTVYQPKAGFSVAGGYARFFTDPFYLMIFWRTVGFGLLVTSITVVFGYPVAFLLSRLEGRLKSVLMVLVVFPLLTNSVVRTFSWMVVLGKFGFVNQALQWLHLTSEPVKILYTPAAVLIGLVHLFLPLLVLSLTSAMENLHPSVLEAAESLGAGPLTTFFRVLLPLTLPGLAVGAALVFTGATTAYVTPQMLGGSRVMMLSTLLYQKAMVSFDWPTATTIAAVSTAVTFLVIGALSALGRRLGASEA